MQLPTKNEEIKEIQFIKKGTGFIGPDGAYYDKPPTPVQLKTLYGSE